MRKLLSIFSFVLLYATIAFGQAAVDIPISVADASGTPIIVNIGLDLTATDGIDAALGEAELPSPPPSNAFDVRMWIPPFDGEISSFKDYRYPAPGTVVGFPFTGHKTYFIKFQTVTATNPMTISWNLPLQIAATSTIGFGANIVPFTGTGSHSWTFNSFSTPGVWLEVDYVAIGPVIPAPVFAIEPASLDFENVFVTASKPLTATVSNPGTDPLVISNITSSDPQFTFAPSTFPITVPPAGGTQVFNVTFTPTSAGPKTGNLIFTHNAAGSPTSYAVQGTGSVTEINPPLIVNGGNFGTIGVGTTGSTIVTVQNIDDALITVGASIIEDPLFHVTPTSLDIPAFGSGDFTVTFTPIVAGTFTGSLQITAPAGSAVPPIVLSGSAFATSGLIFAQDTVYRLEDDSYTDIMQLKALQGNAKAIQFRLLTNQSVGDQKILTFQSIAKGTNVSDASWALDYNVVRGPILPNGASVDTIFVLLYNTMQGPGWTLGPGDWNDLLHVTYRVADLPALADSVPSTIKIVYAQASTYDGNSIDITPNPSDHLTVIAKNRVSSLGDVNGDGCIDILDLIMVVDHIVGRDSLEADEFARANIAPWSPGAPLPTPDLVVNVQDLSLIQNIILTGFFPSGVPVGPCSYAILPKIEGDADATINVYINPEGITVYLDSRVGIRGAQMEFNNVTNNPGSLVINTDLGQGYYLLTDQLLRTLMYDRLGVKYIPQGEHFMADMPFTITNPENIVLDKLILVDINTQRVMSIQVNIFHTPAPVPLDYILFQNYPNPFNPSTSVKFQVPKTSDVTIKVYDMLGQEVRTLFAGEVLRGNYTVEWDGLSNAGVQMSSGSYVYRMIAGEFMQAKKMVYVK